MFPLPDETRSQFRESGGDQRPCAGPKGITLIEVLVVVGVVGVLILLLLPALASSREAARSAQCKANLAKIGLSLMNDMVKKGQGNRTYCSGAFLPQYDGNPREVGWVADLVNGQYMAPARSLCPSNPTQSSAALCLDSLREAFAAGELPDAGAGGDEELEAYRSQLLTEGYGTNYCQIWYMARTRMLPRAARRGLDPDDPLNPANCQGPLRDSTLGAARAPSALVMLLADAAPMTNSDGTWASTITGGPWDLDDPSSPHDFRQIGFHHRSGGRHTANILFADGHVGTVPDSNEDGAIGASEFPTGVRTASFNIGLPGR
jgi:prepilin-type processing-associated H-X9-DG protein